MVFRDALKLLPQIAAHSATATPDLRSIFTARSHRDALDPHREIVVGDRGVGKSFWSSVLRDDAARTAISSVYPELKLDKLNVSLGFAEDIASKEYPSSRSLRSLIDSGVNPEYIWRAVIINSVALSDLPTTWQNDSWALRINWLVHNVEVEEEILHRANRRLAQSSRMHLIIFDALDRLGQDWPLIRALTRSLLSVSLDMRSFSHIGVKIFFRPDMEGDKDIWTIRDGSKLRQNLVPLKWTTRDLYGFVWHWFLHDPDTRGTFMQMVFDITGKRIDEFKGENLIDIPHFLLEEEDVQREIFERLAGKMMGAGTKIRTSFYVDPETPRRRQGPS